MSPVLKLFLEQWLAWAEAGGRKHQPFSHHGLCTNIVNWTCDHYPDDWETRMRVKSEFGKMIDKIDGTCHPFGGESRYMSDMNNEVAHLNELRLNWVKEQLKNV